MHLLSTRGVGDLFESTKHFWSLKVNFVAAESDTIEITGDFTRYKTTEKPSHASILLVWCHPSVCKPRHSYSTRNEVIYILF